MDKRITMNKKILKQFTSITLSIMVAFSMMPGVAFALEGESPENVTETETSTSVPSDTIVDEIPQAAEEAGSTESADTPADIIVEAKGDEVAADSISAGENTGELLQNTSAYSSKMRVYGIYMHRANGSRIDSDRYGDAVLIESNGKYLLMDTGAICPIKGDDDTEIPSSLVSTLKKIGVKELDVYISHFHSDHTGGLKDVCENFTVNRLYLPDLKLCENYKTPSGYSIESRYAKNIDIAKEGNVKEIIFLKPSFREHKDVVYNDVQYCPDARTASKFSVGAVTFSVIGPVGTYTISQFASQDGDCGTKEGHCLNNCSLVTVVQCGNFRFLSAGDIERQEEDALVRKYGSGLNCNMLKANHHGLRTSTTDGFLNKVTPMWSFTENHGYSGSVAAQVKRMRNRGYNYSVLDSRSNFITDVSSSKARIYIDTNNNGKTDERPLTGWIKVTGDKTRYQYYNAGGYIQTTWMWMNSTLYYLDDNSGFRHIGKSVIRGVKVEFDKNGKLISHKAPKKVTLRSAKAKKKHRIKIRWKKAKRAGAYQVFRKTGKNGTYILIGTYGYKKRTLTDGYKIERGKTYYYKVRAIRYVAGGIMYGGFSKAKKAKAR